MPIFNPSTEERQFLDRLNPDGEPSELELEMFQEAKQAWINLGGVGNLPHTMFIPLHCLAKALERFAAGPAEPVREAAVPEEQQPAPALRVAAPSNPSFDGSTMEQCLQLERGAPVSIWRTKDSTVHSGRFERVAKGRVVVRVGYSENPLSYTPANIHIPSQAMAGQQAAPNGYGTFSG